MESKGLRKSDIDQNHWLDVEGIYRKAGRKVEYDSPSWDEGYLPRFIFTKRRSRLSPS